MHGAHEPLEIVGMHPGKERGKLVTVVAHGNKAVQKVAVRHVDVPDPDVRAADRELQPRLGPLQRLLQPLPIRDVLDDRDGVGRRARLVALERDRDLHPDERPVRADVVLLQGEALDLAARERR